MSTRKVLTSIVLVLAMLVLFGTTSVKAATGDFNLGIVYNNSRIELPVNENTKISELKELIKANDKLGIDVNKQRLTITVNDPITFMPKEVVLDQEFNPTIGTEKELTAEVTGLYENKIQVEGTTNTFYYEEIQ